MDLKKGALFLLIILVGVYSGILLAEKTMQKWGA